jgi:hypothetical protein
MRKILLAGVAAIGIAALGLVAPAPLQAQQAAAVAIDNDDIGGVVTGPKGPEAGVWVIAETRDLPVRFIRIVVTDDQGRYVVPDLPKGKYKIWVRGYGLVDSPKVQTTPGKLANLTAVVAPNPAAAAQYYPANYWYSLMKVPDKSEFPGTGPQGNGISPNMKTQAQWLRIMKTDSCWSCHQLGNKATREIPAALDAMSPSSSEARPLPLAPGLSPFRAVMLAVKVIPPMKEPFDWRKKSSSPSV